MKKRRVSSPFNILINYFLFKGYESSTTRRWARYDWHWTAYSNRWHSQQRIVPMESMLNKGLKHVTNQMSIQRFTTNLGPRPMLSRENYHWGNMTLNTVQGIEEFRKKCWKLVCRKLAIDHSLDLADIPKQGLAAKEISSKYGIVQHNSDLIFRASQHILFLALANQNQWSTA